MNDGKKDIDSKQKSKEDLKILFFIIGFVFGPILASFCIYTFYPHNIDLIIILFSFMLFILFIFRKTNSKIKSIFTGLLISTILICIFYFWIRPMIQYRIVNNFCQEKYGEEYKAIKGDEIPLSYTEEHGPLCCSLPWYCYNKDKNELLVPDE